MAATPTANAGSRGALRMPEFAQPTWATSPSKSRPAEQPGQRTSRCPREALRDDRRGRSHAPDGQLRRTDFITNALPASRQQSPVRFRTSIARLLMDPVSMPVARAAWVAAEPKWIAEVAIHMSSRTLRHDPAPPSIQRVEERLRLSSMVGACARTACIRRSSRRTFTAVALIASVRREVARGFPITREARPEPSCRRSPVGGGHARHAEHAASPGPGAAPATATCLPSVSIAATCAAPRRIASLCGAGEPVRVRVGP